MTKQDQIMTATITVTHPTGQYEIQIEKTEEGVIVSGGFEGKYENEHFPSSTVEEFIEDYAKDDDELIGESEYFVDNSF